ncbi:unnamed protein product [Dimorphilus gyrociliatus]|uniref:Uncharacterized protein n=1 Tax=Dimorphilus gyrociliatus TaxID=2664684 RepID=A0A7I8VEJ7_9ANNE|nr:unnamed protein product [Dimorphilus gyrociliatus]
MKNLKDFLRLALIFFSICCIHSAAVYKSCYDAVKHNNYVTGIYDIQPRVGGATSQIYCEMVTRTSVMTVLDNDLESFSQLTAVQTAFSLVLTPKYEYFDDSDMDELLKTAGTCEQNMRFSNNKASNNYVKFSFWNGNYTSFISEDGICKCLISQICEDANDTSLDCYPDIANDKDPIFDLSGKISVLPHRLPLKKMELGDTNDGINKCSVGKLKCTYEIIPKIETIPNNKCNNEVKKLTDGNLQTCVTFKRNELGIKIKVQTIFDYFKISNRNQTLDNIFVQSLKPLNNQVGKCLSTLNLFNCTVSSIGEYIVYFQDISIETEVCEIDIN